MNTTTQNAVPPPPATPPVTTRMSSALHQLGQRIAKWASDFLAARDHRCSSWDELNEVERDLTSRACAHALKQTLGDGFVPLGCPSKKHLRSYLSIEPVPNSANLANIAGFDDLYDEVRALFLGARQSPEITLAYGVGEIDAIRKENAQLRETCAWRSLENQTHRVVTMHASETVERQSNTIKDQDIYIKKLKEELATRGLVIEQLQGQSSTITRLRGEAQMMRDTVDALRNDIAAILKEFRVECPTNNILDMVRSACEHTPRPHATTAPQHDTICRSGDARRRIDINDAITEAQAAIAPGKSFSKLNALRATYACSASDIGGVDEPADEVQSKREDVFVPILRNVTVTTTREPGKPTVVTEKEFTQFEPYRVGEKHPSTGNQQAKRERTWNVPPALGITGVMLVIVACAWIAHHIATKGYGF